MVGVFRRLWRDRAGSSMIEYAFLVAIMVAIIIVGVAVAGSWAVGMWTRLTTILG